MVLCGTCGTHGWGGGVVRQVSHIRGTRRAFSGRAFFEIQTPTAVLSRGACCHIHGLRAGDWDDIRFRGSPENARLVFRKRTSIRGPLGMRPPVPLAPHKIMRGPFLASIGSFLRDSATKSQTAAGDVG